MKLKETHQNNGRREFILKVLEKTGQVALASGVVYVVTVVTDRKDLVAGAK